ncbi:MAG TPA: hypothetical protein PK294_02790 [Ignavibacteria bacterium]|nr:hypothetical protein [Ignavibacteria bacterium]
MDNKTIYTKEELLESLPDFASGNISDNVLSESLTNMIESDSEFKEEFESVKMSLLFLDQSETENPDPAYFNNLSVRINQRIDKELSENKSSEFIENFSRLWKFIIPALTVIIVILYFTLRQSDSEIMVTESAKDKITNDKEQKNINPENKNEPVTSQDNLLNTQQEKNSVKQIDNSKNTTFHKYDIKSVKPDSEKNYDQLVTDTQKSNDGIFYEDNVEEELNNEFFISGLVDFIDSDIESESNESIDIFENSDLEIINSESSEDQNLQNEFRELTPSEQQEILNILKKTQI